jgi:hypothetical protein
MNSKEKEIVNNYGQQWVEAIDRQTVAMDRLVTAIKYMADIIGFRGDDINPKTPDGKAMVTIEIDQPLPKDDEPLITYTLADLKDALNGYVRKVGKDKAMEYVNQYSISGKVTDIHPDNYNKVIEGCK